MNTKMTARELLQWRLARAEAEAPPAPRASRLLELARPWWEKCPERFQKIAHQLNTIQMGYGHAKVELGSERSGHIVPTLIVGPDREIEASAQILHFDLRGSMLRLRFELGKAFHPLETAYEVTFFSNKTKQPLFSVTAQRAVGSEYWLNVSLTDTVRQSWQGIKVTDRMPFRLILRPEIEED